MEASIQTAFCFCFFFSSFIISPCWTLSPNLRMFVLYCFDLKILPFYMRSACSIGNPLCFYCINFDILGVTLQDISIVEKWVSDP